MFSRAVFAQPGKYPSRIEFIDITHDDEDPSYIHTHIIVTIVVAVITTVAKR